MYNSQLNLFEQNLDVNELKQSLYDYITSTRQIKRYPNGQNSLGVINSHIWQQMTNDIKEYVSKNKSSYNQTEFSRLCCSYFDTISSDIFELDVKIENDKTIYNEVLDTTVLILENLQHMDQSIFNSLNRFVKKVSESPLNNFSVSSGVLNRILKLECKDINIFKHIVDAIYVNSYLIQDKFSAIEDQYNFITGVSELNTNKQEIVLNSCSNAFVDGLSLYYANTGIKGQTLKEYEYDIVWEITEFNKFDIKKNSYAKAEWLCTQFIKNTESGVVNSELHTNTLGNIMSIHGFLDSLPDYKHIPIACLTRKRIDEVGELAYGNQYKVIKEQADILDLNKDYNYWMHAKLMLENPIQNELLPEFS